MIPLTMAEEIRTTILDYLATTFNFQDKALAEYYPKFGEKLPLFTSVNRQDNYRVAWAFFEGLHLFILKAETNLNTRKSELLAPVLQRL
jgi:hypothetical protein